MNTTSLFKYASASSFLAIALLSSPAHSETDPYGSVANARAAEANCMTISNLEDKQTCLDGITDWWFDFGGAYVTYNPYLEMTRIFKIQLDMEPTRIETISSLAYYTYSIEVDNIVNKTQSDFTTAPMDAFLSREQYNSNNVEFYNMALDVPALVVIMRSSATDATRVLYYANLKHNYFKACELIKEQVNPNSACDAWAKTAPFSGPCQPKFAQPELGVCVAAKTLTNYKKYDR